MDSYDGRPMLDRVVDGINNQSSFGKKKSSGNRNADIETSQGLF